MMHTPHFKNSTPEEEKGSILMKVDAFRRSMDDLIPILRNAGTSIAIENMWGDNWEVIFTLLAEYPADVLGICYDSGHANSNELKQMDFLEKGKSRLAALHLHENDGSGDQHRPPFYGTVDWPRLAGIIATSGYPRQISYEMSIGSSQFRIPDVMPQPEDVCRAFLKDAYERCVKFAQMVETARRKVQTEKA